MENSENIRKLSVFKFAGPRYSSQYSPNVIAEGRGKEWGGDSFNERECFEVDAGGVSDGIVYLNCEGNIIGGCDWSFESQRDHENIISAVEEFSIEKVEEFIGN